MSFDLESFVTRHVDAYDDQTLEPVPVGELRLILNQLRRAEKERDELRAAYLAVEEENAHYHDVSAATKKRFGPQGPEEIVLFAVVRQRVDREIAALRIERELRAHDITSVELTPHHTKLLRREGSRQKTTAYTSLLEALDACAVERKI